jgi:hypothetical protein
MKMTMKTRVNTHKNSNLPLPLLLPQKMKNQIKLQRKVAKRSQNSKKSREREATINHQSNLPRWLALLRKLSVRNAKES